MLRGAHLDPLAVYEHGLHGEVDADGVAMALDERAGPEALHHAGLARAAVADQHDLEQVVKALVVARAHHQVVGVAARHSHRDSRGGEGDGDDGRIRTLPTSRMTIYAIAVSTKPLVHPVASILVHLTAPLQFVSAANRGTADPPTSCLPASLFGPFLLRAIAFICENNKSFLNSLFERILFMEIKM